MPRSRGATRREFLRGAGALGAGVLGGALAPPSPAHAGGADSFGPLEPPDANGLQLPPGFTSRVVATAGAIPAAGSSYAWHDSPDGGATFATAGGGWIYVSNSEVGGSNGGVGALVFGRDGTVVDAYAILSGTNLNCAGGPTPWDTWLSCEERGSGEVYECDPYAPNSNGTPHPQMGVFRHEAAAVDPVYEQVYETEDEWDGLLYRYSPTSYPDLSAGALEAAEILGSGNIAFGEVRDLAWHPIPEPTETPTRFQAPLATLFDGGEGCWYEGGFVYFSTKGDGRVWKIDTDADTIEILYDGGGALSNVDNVYAAPTGDVYVAEDPGNLEIVALTPLGAVKPIVRVTGQSGTEITGPALSPDGQRLYFSSQRGPGVGGSVGITYEVAGPFVPAAAIPTLGGLGRVALAAGLGALLAMGLRRRPVRS